MENGSEVNTKNNNHENGTSNDPLDVGCHFLVKRGDSSWRMYLVICCCFY